ncbi:MAG: MotA/TolQ/ExbB proton channel family protein, partial [Pseudomonadota bacterium]
AKSKGMMQLERDIERPYESELFGRFPRVLKHKMSIGFLCDYLRLISLGSEKSHELESLMDQEIETLHKEMSRPLKALQTMAETLPALGIIAAVLGVIKAMGYINQSTEILGGMIGGALVGTFLGILLSYGLVMPIAGIVRARRDERVNYHICIKAGLLAYLNGYAPQICIEYARKVLYSDVQPSFDAVEQATTFNTAARADTAAARAA